MKLPLVVAALLFAAPVFAHGPDDPAEGEPNGAEPAELAEHPGGHGGHPAGPPHVNWFEWSEHSPPVGWYAINFIVFIGALVHFTRKPLGAAMQKRHDSIKSTIEENQKAFDAAQHRHDTYRTKLAHVDQESRELVDSSKGDGALERDRIIAGARDYARRLRSDAENVAKNEEERARLRLKSDIAHSALKSAEEMLRRGLTDADRELLFEQSLQMIEQIDTHHNPRRVKSSPPTQAAGDA
jgi:F0F1-type ATP synthase membrane subunit b/b'